ncbi:MAG: molybdopterin molybdotransferase MoeA [Oscillospiraceae bacterium]|nr:molybdopterin molybdotransferase MoeA [Oscillospiraceae bacterium]
MDKITLETARDLILSHTSPIRSYDVTPLEELCGRVCAEDVYAPADHPSFSRSAMDGYAVRAEDIKNASPDSPAVLDVIATVYAGDHTGKFAPCTAVRVMTGAFIPQGYDTVVMQEDTDEGEERVSIYRSLRAFTNYCHAGEEFHKGDLLIRKGTLTDRVHIFRAASAGIAAVRTVTPPRIGIIATGSELDLAGTPHIEGHIYNGLMPMLCASVQRFGAECVYCLGCEDDTVDISETIQGVIGDVDMLITTGGVSVGKRDLMPDVFADLRAKILFHGTDIQPGTPTMAGVYDGKVILALSGNPFAAIANLDYYFPYIISRLTGCESLLTEEKTAVLADRYDKVNRLRRFVRARFADGMVYLPTDRHFSSVAGNLTECNCYIDIPAETPLNVGSTVNIRIMRN